MREEARVEKLLPYGRTLFTSDWHIGADTWGIDRREELASSISSLAKEAARAGVQNVVVGGDVFDSFRYPGREDLRFAASLLFGFFKIPSVKRMIVVEGNHDWNDIGVWPDIAFPPGAGERQFIVAEHPSWIETESGYLSLVPHLRRHAVRGSFEETISGAIPPQVPSAPVLLCAHMALQGTMPELDMEGPGGEPQMTRKALSMYGQNLKGAFFGHIHKVQEYTPGPARNGGGDYGIPCRYIGTPIKVSFSEEKHRNGGWVADFSGAAVFVDVPSRELITVRGNSRSEVEELLINLGREQGDRTAEESDAPYIRVIIESDERISAEEIGMVAPEIAENVVTIKSGQNEGEKQGQSEGLPHLEYETQGRGTISVPGILESYFEERTKDPETAEMLTSIGHGLLRGERPEELWKSMKEGRSLLNDAEAPSPDEVCQEVLEEPDMDLQDTWTLCPSADGGLSL